VTPEEADDRFGGLLLDVLGDKSREISPDLRERLRLLWREGVKTGLYLEREQQPVPESLFTKWESRRVAPREEIDPRREPGKYAELLDAKDRLVLRIEELAILIEHELSPERTLGVGGVDLAKARHKFLTRVQQVSRAVDRLHKTVWGFRE